MAKSSVSVGKLVRVCPGKFHAWFESNIGLIRKPYIAPEPKYKEPKYEG